MDYMERCESKDTSRSVAIGSSVTVCPGVTMGKRCIIAIGSIVVRDIPDDNFAIGNPAVVERYFDRRES